MWTRVHNRLTIQAGIGKEQIQQSAHCAATVTFYMKPLSLIRIVLVSTSQRGNIGAAARALKTMGLSKLHLVTPRFDDALGHPEAVAFAASATDVLAQTKIHATLDEALAGCSWAVAMTARNRDISVPEMEVRNAVAKAITLTSTVTDAATHSFNEVAFVFGSERYGLDNEDVMKCQVCCTLPTSPDYTSLNLAQAVQIIAYECRLAALAASDASVAPIETQEQPLQFASHEQREQFFAHLQEALIAIEFLNPEYPKKLMQRLRRLFARTELEQEEISILRGICTAILSQRRK